MLGISTAGKNIHDADLMIAARDFDVTVVDTLIEGGPATGIVFSGGYWR